MDDLNTFRLLVRQAREADAQRRAGLDEMVASVRASLGEDPLALRMFECLAIERALLDALMRNTDAMLRVFEDAASTD